MKTHVGYLIRIYFFVSIILFATADSYAQKPETKQTKTSDVKQQPTQDELLRDLLFCECLKLKTALQNIPKGPSMITSVAFLEWIEKYWIHQDPSDPNHAHDPVTGQNYNWDSDKKAWIDSKTGECICPKCETAKEDKKETPEPKKEINEKKTAMKEKTSSSNNLLAGNTGNFEVCAGVGYGLPFNNGLLGQNKVFTATNRSFDGVYGSWAAGENFFIKTDFKVSNCFGAGVEFDYVYGKQYDYTTNTIGATSTTNQFYEGRYTGYSATPFIQFNPCGSNRFAPYVDLGLRLNFSNSIKQTINQTQTSNNNTTVTIQKATFKGAFTPGFDAALGFKYRLNRNWSLIGEIDFSNSNFVASEGTITSYTVNGADQLSTLNTSQKQVEYVKSYTVPNSGFDPNSPSKALRDEQKASCLLFRVGFSCQFGSGRRVTWTPTK